MTRYSHYTNYGAQMAPSCADADGYLAYREDFNTELPPEEWTEAEEWIEGMCQAIDAWHSS